MSNEKPVEFCSFAFAGEKGDGYGNCEIFEKINSGKMIVDLANRIKKEINAKFVTILNVIYYDDAR